MKSTTCGEAKPRRSHEAHRQNRIDGRADRITQFVKRFAASIVGAGDAFAHRV
jgi:hypothetical protein